MDFSHSPSPSTGLPWAHPIVRDWFLSRFGSPTQPQQEGWPHIVAGQTVLISAPTGSGKTLAAFLAAIDSLFRKAIAGTLEDKTEVVYVSPLRALSTDIENNLQTPLAEIQALAISRGLSPMPIRSAVRTGDTLAAERRKMVAQPPHILVTTPESLYILLTAERSRQMLRTAQSVIVDEIHAVADDKRGAHLSLSLERLETLAGRPIPRIGLSATQKPIERLGRFLAGAGRPAPVIVEIGRRRSMDLGVEVPRSELGPIATNEIWDETYDRIAELAGGHRSTLVFVNTRRLAERVAFHLADRMGNDAVATHHGSLARKLRREAERRLKAGELRALVATASLELGIDIGAIDLVCQIGSPRSISVTLQRIGRSGHWRGAVPKGRLMAVTRDDLLECAALVRAIRSGDLDAIEVPRAPLDVMAQQIVAACAAEEWSEDDLFRLVRRADPYGDLSRADFEETVAMLSEGIATRRGRRGAWLHRDRVNARLRGRRGARLVALTNAGAIPETALYPVVSQPEGATVGAVDEDFAVESLRGDVFLLGNRSWQIRRIEKGRVLVEDAGEAPPNVPFWRGEAPARTRELSLHVADLRGEIARRLEPHAGPTPTAEASPAAAHWLREECGLDRAGAEQAVEYVASGRAALGVVPDSGTFVAERFFDESGGMQLVIHAPLGGRINKAWGLALRKRFCRSFNFELQAAATDNGIVLSLGEQHSFPLASVFRFLTAATTRHLLEQATLPTPLFTSRWRWNSARSLALPRFQAGRKVPPNIARMRAEDLLAAVFPEALGCPENLPGDIPIPDHPLVRETMKDALTEALDIEGLERVLEQLATGAIRTVAVDTAGASPFSHEILNANPYAFLDNAPLEERRARAVSLRRILPEQTLGEIGRLDPEAVADVAPRLAGRARLRRAARRPAHARCLPRVAPGRPCRRSRGHRRKIEGKRRTVDAALRKACQRPARFTRQGRGPLVVGARRTSPNLRPPDARCRARNRAARRGSELPIGRGSGDSNPCGLARASRARDRIRTRRTAWLAHCRCRKRAGASRRRRGSSSRELHGLRKPRAKRHRMVRKARPGADSPANAWTPSPRNRSRHRGRVSALAAALAARRAGRSTGRRARHD